MPIPDDTKLLPTPTDEAEVPLRPDQSDRAATAAGLRLDHWLTDGIKAP